MPVLKHGLLGDEGGVPGGSAALHKEDGWTAHKIHPHSDPKADIEICEAVHEAVGDDMKLMLDSMWAYEYDDTIRVGRAIEDLDYYWYEDPLAEEDLYSYVELTRNSTIPIMATEFAAGRCYGMTQWITNYATDILRGDVAVTAGITPLVRPLPPRRGLQDEVRDPLRRQLAEQRRQPARNDGGAQLRVHEFFPCTSSNVYGLVEASISRGASCMRRQVRGSATRSTGDRLRKDHVGTVGA